jgi:hypothetical protein
MHWEAAATHYRNRHQPARPAAAAAPARSEFPWRAGAVCVLLFVGHQGYHSYFSDFARGRSAGVAHVREMAAKGAFVRAGMNLGNLLDLIPSDPNGSPDWNAGFRAGFKDELDRMNQPARK